MAKIDVNILWLFDAWGLDALFLPFYRIQPTSSSTAVILDNPEKRQTSIVTFSATQQNKIKYNDLKDFIGNIETDQESFNIHSLDQIHE